MTFELEAQRNGLSQPLLLAVKLLLFFYLHGFIVYERVNCFGARVIISFVHLYTKLGPEE